MSDILQLTDAELVALGEKIGSLRVAELNTLESLMPSERNSRVCDALSKALEKFGFTAKADLEAIGPDGEEVTLKIDGLGW
jgi:hypothetical protein